MGISKCYSLMKCLLIIFNIIFLVVGVGACGLAAWALYEGRAGAGEAAAARAGLCAVAAWGGALAAGAAAALAGAVRHSASLLAAAFALLALCAVAEGGAAWWGLTHAEALRAALRAALERAVREEYGAVESRTAALDAIQRGLRCCGAAGARDWQASAWARAQRPPGDLDLSVLAAARTYPVPASCCAAPGAACEAARRVPAAAGAARGLHAAACAPRVLAALADAARAPLWAGAALLAAHGAALLLALALCLRAHPRPHYKA